MFAFIVLALMPLQSPNFTSKRADDLYRRSAPKVANMEDHAEFVIKSRGPFSLTAARIEYSAHLFNQIQRLEKIKKGLEKLGLVKETETYRIRIEDLEQKKKDLGLGFYDKMLKSLWEQTNQAGRDEAKKNVEVSLKNVELSFEYERLDVERFCELIDQKFQAKRDLAEATKAYQDIEKVTQDRAKLLGAYKAKKEASDLLGEANRELKKAQKWFFIAPTIEP